MGGSKKPTAINVHAIREKRRAVEDRVKSLRAKSSSKPSNSSESPPTMGDSSSSAKAAAPAGKASKGKAVATSVEEIDSDGFRPIPARDVTIVERGTMQVDIEHSDMMKVKSMLPRRPEQVILRVKCRGLTSKADAASMTLDVQDQVVLVEYTVG